MINKENKGFRQFDSNAFPEMLKECGLENQAVTDVVLNYPFICSSTEVVNGVLDEIASRIDCV